MPRTARIDSPGLLQHVIVRGVDRRDVFLDEDDRRRFLQRLSALLRETGTDCYAWALLTNHVHLLLRCHDIELSRFMRRLLTGYAVYFNRRHDRCGHLFQNRYKSIVCDQTAYLLELIRYIHLNPLRAGLVDDLQKLDDFPWCGHGVLLGRSDLPGQVVDEVLQLFGDKDVRARREYRQFVADGLPMGSRPELVGSGSAAQPGEHTESFADRRVLGTGDFVEGLRSLVALREQFGSRLGLDELRARVAASFSLNPQDIMCRRRGNPAAEARALFCCLAVRTFAYSAASLGRYLQVDDSAVSRAVSRGMAWMQKNPGQAESLLNH